MAPSPAKLKKPGKLPKPKPRTYASKDNIKKLRAMEDAVAAREAAAPTTATNATAPKTTAPKKSANKVTKPQPAPRTRAEPSPSISERAAEALQEWTCVIVAESEEHYTIKWDGIDPKTKRPWKNTVEPKKNANSAAVEDWVIKKQRRQEREAERAREKEEKQRAEEERRSRVLADFKATQEVMEDAARELQELQRKKRQGRAGAEVQRSARAGAEQDNSMEEPRTPIDQTEDSGHIAPDDAGDEDDAEGGEEGSPSSDGIVVSQG